MGRKSVYGHGRNNYGGRNDFMNAEEFNNGNVAGAFDNENVAGAFDNGNAVDERTIVEPTRNVVNTRIIPHVIRRVHPTHIENINRHVYRVENYYPVTESARNETVVNEFNCGNDLENPCCKPVKRCHK